MSKSDAYIQKMKAKIDEWDANLDALKAKAKGVTAEAKIEYGEKIASLEELKDSAKVKIKALEDAGEDAWDDLQEGVDVAWKSVSNAFNDVMKKLK